MLPVQTTFDPHTSSNVCPTMTVSLTTTDSNANPPTPNDMTTTETTPPSCNTTAVSSPSSVIDKDDQTDVPEPVSVVADVDVITPSGAQDDETDVETSTEYAGDDETNVVINSQSESVATSSPVKSSNKRARDSDSDDGDHTGDLDVSANECDVKKLKSRDNDQLCASSPLNATTHNDNSVINKVLDSKAKGGTDNLPEDMSSQDVAEMARFRAAKFIQERTKMACLLPTSAEAESVKQTVNPSPVTSGHQTTTRKRKLTVKDILVSQRSRDSTCKQPHQQPRVSNTDTPPIGNNIGLTQMFPGLGQILDPNPQLNDSNPLAAFTAALAAAAAGQPNGLVSQAESNVPSGLDSQSAYISTLASTLSSNSNPTAALALMASLSAMMQQNTVNSKDNAESGNQSTQLESNAPNNSYGHLQTKEVNDDDHVDRTETSTAPLDFSRKTYESKDTTDKPSVKRKMRKKSNGFENEDETPLDLSVSTKRPDEPMMANLNKPDSSPLSSMLSQVPVIDGANGSNIAAMAAAAAAAAASFSPNLLTRMAASMAPWSNYGLQGLKLGNDPAAATAAFAALFQQANHANQTSPNKPANSMPSPNPANLFQSFPDLYWNGKLSNKTSTSSPSFGVLNNSVSSISSRHHHHPPPPAASQPMRTKSSSGRQNPWQAQWINRSSEQTRDVFTCVWCKESFKSLAEMTDHMKRSPRCGMAGMQQHHSHHHGQTGTGHHTQQPVSGQSQQAQSKISMNSPSNSSSSTSKETPSHTNSTPAANLITTVKSGNVNMPRKLVRGQDVWLGRGAEQTRQILKCMWCGQSFKSLADMTQHMKVTQHYTNIISQEQIISWRTPEEKMNQSQVNAVLTCKVCDEAFSSLKELSNHMIKNSHFKENGGKENGSTRSGASTPTPPALNATTPPTAVANSRNNNGRASGAPVSSDRRKKSLPVRKLLELEREEYRKSGDDDDDMDDMVKSAASQLIECDDCHDKIEPRCFLQHIKQCRLRNSKSDAESDKSKTDTDSHGKHSDLFKESTKEEEDGKDDERPVEKISESKNESKREGGEETSSGSVLSALEKLIEKNFDTKSRRTQQTGILQRLGIDEEVFPPWQNMAPSPLNAMSPTMNTWNSMNGMEFSRSNSSSSSNSRINSVPPVMPQLRYRRNSSSASLKDKFFTGLNTSIKATESNGSFSSQETEEEESCDDSNSDCGSNGVRRKKKAYSTSRARQMEKNSRLNFPISSMLSSPIPNRPMSASSTASSISPSEPVTPSHVTAEQLHRMTPNSHRSNQEETDEDTDLVDSPLALCKKSFSEEPDKKVKTNGVNDEETDEENTDNNDKPPSHHPLMQLQKLLDKTDNSARHSSVSRNNNNPRSSPFTGWHDPASIKAMSPSSSPRTPPNMQHSPSSASAKSEQDATSYLLLKCAFCDTQIASRASYRSHLAKYHLSMRDSVDLSAISDEELLLLVLAKNSNLPLGNSHGNLLATAPLPSNKNRGKESKRKSKSSAHTWDKSPNLTKSPSPSPQLETSQSKFLKYTELAKQLSSKYV